MDKYKITENEKVSGVVAAPNTLTDTAQNNKMVFDRLPKLIATRFNSFVDAVVEKFKGYYTKEETESAIADQMAAIGSGDMAKFVYDANRNGVVDDAEKLGGQLPSYYATKEEMQTTSNAAAKAQTTADTAIENAAKAQTTANTANTTANTANTTAKNAMPKANFSFSSSTATLNITL